MIRHRRKAIREPAAIGPAPVGTAEAIKTPPITVVFPRAGQVVDISPANLTTTASRVMEKGDGRKVVEFFNDGPGVVYLGGQGVTTANGRPLYANQGFVETNAPEAEWWAVSNGTALLRRLVMQ